MIDRLTIQRITEAARIEEVVGDFIALKRTGVNLKGLCPFHDDRTPSFIVSPAKNYCKCFSCGEGGNPVTFVMKHEQISYPEALKYLAKKYGIEVREKELTPEEIQHNDDRESMFILNDWALKWFRHQLMETEDGRAIGLSYFRQRGFRDDILERFQVGFCPNTRGIGIGQDALKAGFQERFITNTPNEQDTRQSVGTGLCFKNDNGELRDRFFGRVMWPIFTLSGRVAGFGGRVLDAATKGVNIKYQNSPESIVYSKRRELYGLYQSKQAIAKQDLCYLVEGYTDVMAMHQSGVENVVASSGTALTEEQIRLIHRLTQNIVLIFDADAAGIKASQRGIDMLLRQGMNVKLLSLPNQDDPDSFARKHTAQEFQDYLRNNQTDFIKFKTNLLMEQAQGDPIAMSRLVGDIVQSIAVIPDAITRSLYVRETASMMSLSEKLISDAVAKQVAHNTEEWRKKKEREKRQQALSQLSTGDAPPPPPPSQGMPEEEWVPPTESEATGIASQEASQAAVSLAQESPRSTERKQQRLRNKERELVRAIVRYGEQLLEVGSEDNPVEISVASLISEALGQDGLELQTPIFKEMMQLALDNESEPGFVAERFFLSHPDERISRMAFELATDKAVLSKLHTRQRSAYEPEPESIVPELIPHLLTDYKLEIIHQQLDDVMHEMKDPQLLQDKERYTQTMRRFMQLKEIEKRLGVLRGDRVLR